MTNFFAKNVAYLEDKDFDAEGNLTVKGIPNDLPVVVMIQASWCGHCKNAKPAFQEFANKMEGKVAAATIQSVSPNEMADYKGKEHLFNSQMALAKRLPVIKPGFRGFPDYVLFVNGKRQNKDVKGRDVDSLIEFASL